MINGVTKQAAVIDREVWVFDIDATNANDIFLAVTIAANFFKVSAKEIMGDVYTKNLNADSVTTNEKTKHFFKVGSNDGKLSMGIKTHLHLATLKV